MRDYPKLYDHAPFWLPEEFVAITLPPFGIFVRQRVMGEQRRRVLDHELIHWEQYLRHGALGYYVRYLWQWMRAGFSYERHPMEIEARERSGAR